MNAIRGLSDKVKEFIDIKVRLRDPLDDNAHLIPSSRIISRRTINKVLTHC